MSGDEILIRGMSWPSGDGTHLDLDAARDSGRRMRVAGQDVSALRSGIGASIDSAGQSRPWGADDVGQALDEGYSKIAPTILTLWQQVGTALQAMGDNINLAADNTTATDVAMSQRAQQAGNHNPNIPT
jgi:hypothetical protein